MELTRTFCVVSILICLFISGYGRSLRNQDQQQPFFNNQQNHDEPSLKFPTEDEQENTYTIPVQFSSTSISKSPEEPGTDQSYFPTGSNSAASASATAAVNKGTSSTLSDSGQEDDIIEDEDLQKDKNFLANVDINSLTPEQKQIYDELIELAEEENEASKSQVQGRTFGLFKLKFNYLWNKFKSLFGPKYLEFYAGEPQQQPHYFHDDYKKRDDQVSNIVQSPHFQVYPTRGESIWTQLPIVGPLTKLVSKTLFGPNVYNYNDDSYQQYSHVKPQIQVQHQPVVLETSSEDFSNSNNNGNDESFEYRTFNYNNNNLYS